MTESVRGQKPRKKGARRGCAANYCRRAGVVLLQHPKYPDVHLSLCERHRGTYEGPGFNYTVIEEFDAERGGGS